MNLTIKESYKDLKTPCYILDEGKLEKNYYDLKNSFTAAWSEKFIIGYSFKTNSLPWVLNWIKENGGYAEVVSEPEYRLALNLGFDKEKVVINGPYKGLDALRETLDNNAIVNLDSFHEIEWIKNNKPSNDSGVWKLGLRINFDLESKCPGETIMGSEPGRFGFNIENGSLEKAIQELKEIPYVKIVGLHGHHSTRTKSLKIFTAISEALVDASKDIMTDIEYIDLGGCVFGDKPGAPSFDEYASTITNILKRVFDPSKVTLIMEPGAALVASPFKYLCKVIDVKEVFEKTFVSTDGSLIHIDPQMHGIPFYKEAFGSGEKVEKEQILGGFTCIEKDRMGIVKNENELRIDDYVLFHNTGAYSMSLSPLFIQYYPHIYVEKNNKIHVARAAWGVDEYIANSNIK